MKIINEQHIRSMLGAQSDRETLVEQIAHYYSQKYPKAGEGELTSAARLLVEYATGRDARDNHPVGHYARQVIAGVLCGKMTDRVHLSDMDAQTEIVFHLIETIYFKARESRATARRAQMLAEAHYGEPVSKPETEAERRRVITDAITLLEATKASFKSKLVAEAKEKLQTLL